MRKIFQSISINNLCLGVSQVGINTSLNLIKKLILLSAPLTNGLSLLPYGPIAIIQAAIAVNSTNPWEISSQRYFKQVSCIDPSIMIKNITLQEPEILNHINIYLSNRNLNNNF